MGGGGVADVLWLAAEIRGVQGDSQPQPQPVSSLLLETFFRTRFDVWIFWAWLDATSYQLISHG